MKRRIALKNLSGAGMGVFLSAGSKNYERQNKASMHGGKPFYIEKMPEYVETDTEILKTGICQVYTEPWDLENNLIRTLNAIDEAAEKGAEIAVTPECVIHGYAWDESLGK